MLSHRSNGFHFSARRAWAALLGVGVLLAAQVASAHTLRSAIATPDCEKSEIRLRLTGDLMTNGSFSVNFVVELAPTDGGPTVPNVVGTATGVVTNDNPATPDLEGTFDIVHTISIPALAGRSFTVSGTATLFQAFPPTNPGGQWNTIAIRNAAGASKFDVDCRRPTASLGDRVWEDLDADGRQDCADTSGNGILGDATDAGPECADAGIPDVPVALGRRNQGVCEPVTPSRTTTTDAAGFYLFSDLAPGEYCVIFDKKALPEDFCDSEGFELGMPQFTVQLGSPNQSDNSDADPTSGGSGGLTLAARDVNRNLDAGIVCPAKIGNFVWEDLDGDGVQDPNEPGVPDVTVELYECGPDGEVDPDTASFVGERETDADGMYMFGGEPGVFDLAPGDYFVRFVKPDGTALTQPKVDDGGADPDARDSDCLAPEGVTQCTTLDSRDVNLDRDCGLVTPRCDLVLDKQCRVEPPPPPPSAGGKCSGKLAQFTVIWNGAAPISITGVGAGGSTTSGTVQPGDEVTVNGPFSSNDVVVSFAGGGVGRSTFHVSCSDGDMDGDTASNVEQQQVSPLGQDCGKTQGNGKGSSGFDNTWLLEGFVDNAGRVLDCTVPDDGDFADACTFTRPPAPSCATLGSKPRSLVFQYTGGGCAASDNDQAAGKAVCTPTGGPLAGPVTVVAAGSSSLTSDVYAVSPAGAVAPGGTFELTFGGSTFKSNSYLQLRDGSGNLELDQIHTSCSQPLAAGDVFGSLTLLAINGQDAGVNVTYQYTVTNGADPLSDVFVTDNPLGDVAGPFDLGAGESRSFEVGPVRLTGTTTNVATASGLLGGEECTASDSVTVAVIEPTCSVAIALDKIEDDKLKLKLSNSGAIDATLARFELAFPSAYGVIKEVKLDGSIYKSSDSSLVVAPGVAIESGQWTNADASKRQLDPGETRTLEIVFSKKAKGFGASAFDLSLEFAEGCSVEF